MPKKKNIDVAGPTSADTPSDTVCDAPKTTSAEAVDEIPASGTVIMPTKPAVPSDNSESIIREFRSRLSQFQAEYDFCVVCQNSSLAVSVPWLKALRDISLYRYQLYRVFSQPSFPVYVVWPSPPNVSYITSVIPKT